MAKEDIKKALELCIKNEDCEKCPYCDKGCTLVLRKDSFTLIIEQDAEIERLKEVIKNYKEVLCETTQRKDDAIKWNDTLVDIYEVKIKQSKIDVLNKVKDIVFDYLGVKNIKEAEALSLLDSTLTYDVVTCGIDELIKEIEK